MASGLALGFGVMRVINVAQGALIILGAYLSYSLYGHFGIDPFVGLLIVTPAMFVLGIGLQLVFLRPLRDEEREELSLLVTWAIALGIEGLLSVAYQTTYRSTITSYADRSWHVAGYYISVARGYAFLASFVVLGLLFAILRFTKLGRAIRATVQNPTAARLLGVDTRMVVGRRLRAQRRDGERRRRGLRDRLPVQPGQPLRPDLAAAHDHRARRARLARGRGDRRALHGRLRVGLRGQISPTWSSFTFFVVLIAMLVVRPQGLFGARVRGSI